MTSAMDELAFRESAFAWLRAQMIIKPAFTRDDLAKFEYLGKRYRLLGPYTGIWKPKELSSALSFSTAFRPDGASKPYEDEIGVDGMLRYKWRGRDANHADNIALRTAMQRGDDLIWFLGVGYEGVRTQLYEPIFPVRLVDEEPLSHQFVVSVEVDQIYPGKGAEAQVIDIAKRYNERIVKVRYHQPLFRSQVLVAYKQKCAVCRLPFSELLDAAHIKPDSEGGSAKVNNGLALCKIHHGAFDSNIIGITPDYTVRVKESVLATFDGPTLQHSIKEMNGETLRQIPDHLNQQPDKDLLAERYEMFLAAG